LITTTALDKHPLVSIIIPTSNRFGFLKETVASILAQTYSNFELIIVSDKSSDETSSIIDIIGDSRCHLYNLEVKSNGPSFVRNYGITKSSGGLVAFCDDDDLWVQDKLEKQVAVMVKNTDIALIATNVKYFGDVAQSFKYTAILKNLMNRIPFIPLKYLLAFYNCVVISSSMVRKEILNDMKFKEEDEYQGHEDLDLWLRICATKKAFIIPQYLTLYRVHPNQISTSLNKNYKKKSLDILRKHTAGFNYIQRFIANFRIFTNRVTGY
jgi:teichuronic acid biosynthesis glycosyltransferase TuaG